MKFLSTQSIVMIVASVLTVIGRFLIEPRLNLPTSTGSYEAMTHIYVGVLLGVWLCRGPYATTAGFHALGITVVEVVAFTIQKNQ